MSGAQSPESEYNSADEGDVNNRRVLHKNAVDTEIDDLKWLMSTEQGRRIVSKLFELSGVFRPSYTGNSKTFYNEGQRSIGLPYYEQVTTHCPDEFILLLKEHRNV